MSKQQSRDYLKKLAFEGDWDTAAQWAVDRLATIGFLYEGRMEDRMRFKGPGMNSTKENPLVAVSELQLHYESGELVLFARMGGLKRLIRIMGVMLLCLCLGLMIVFRILFTDVGGFQPWIFPVLPLAPWIFILPILYVIHSRRAARALDAFLQNVVAATEP